MTYRAQWSVRKGPPVRFGVIGGLLMFISNILGCWGHPCSADYNCDDGIYCNGLEVCTIDGAYIICDEVVPIDCDDGFVCDEEQDACVPENSLAASAAFSPGGR